MKLLRFYIYTEIGSLCWHDALPVATCDGILAGGSADAA